MSKNAEFQKNREIQERRLRDRQLANVDGYEKGSQKAGGVFDGFEGVERDDIKDHKQKYMMKPAAMTPARVKKKRFGSQALSKQEKEKNDVLREYMAPFDRLLYGNAPVIGMATDKPVAKVSKGSSGVAMDAQEDAATLHVRSKFYNEGFQTLSDYKKGQGGSKKGPQKLKKFEKIVAACIALGDSDWHDENLGLIERNGEPQVVKIDHGHAGEHFTFNEKQIRANLCESLLHTDVVSFRYDNVKFSIDDFKQGVDEVANISDEEMENIVRHRSYELQRMGFKLDDNVTYAIEGDRTKHKLSPADEGEMSDKERMNSRYKNMEANYIELYRRQKEALKDLSKVLEIISKIDMPQKWKDRDWIEISDQDPIRWAVENGKTIEGKDPMRWAVENGKTIEGLEPIQWEAKRQEDLLNKEVAEANRSSMVVQEDAAPAAQQADTSVQQVGASVGLTEQQRDAADSSPPLAKGDLLKKRRTFASISPTQYLANVSASASNILANLIPGRKKKAQGKENDRVH
jgi:hypothetical protein